MRRKLLCISAAMVFGIWCAGISFVLAVGLALAVFLFGKVMQQNPQIDYSLVYTFMSILFKHQIFFLLIPLVIHDGIWLFFTISAATHNM